MNRLWNAGESPFKIPASKNDGTKWITHCFLEAMMTEQRAFFIQMFVE